MTCRSLSLAVLAATLIAAPALAQSPGDLRDDQLISGVASATEQEDAKRLLSLMLEVKARGLLMFEPLKQCEPVVPQTAFFESEFHEGATLWAYSVELWEMAIADKYCGCLFEQMSLDELSQKVMSKPASDLVNEDFKVIRLYRRDERRDMRAAYKAFRSDICGVD